MKVNLTGPPGQRLLNVPAELTPWTHPRVIGMDDQVFFGGVELSVFGLRVTGHKQDSGQNE